MITILFVIILLLTVTITNKKNEAQPSDEVLEFNKIDSLVIFICFISSIFIEQIAEKFDKYYILILLISNAIFLMILIIVNINREKFIKNKHDQIINIFQALADVLGRVDLESIDFNKIPFVIEEDKEKHLVNKITIDTSIPGGRFNENTIILAQYSINKFFPDLQWTSKVDFPKRQLIFKGLPRPPQVAKFPGSNYRPTGWIPLGLSGAGEVGWNLSDPKDLGISSYISENGSIPQAVELPSAPQALTLGSTGGGKSIFIEQEVDIMLV